MAVHGLVDAGIARLRVVQKIDRPSDAVEFEIHYGSFVIIKEA